MRCTSSAATSRGARWPRVPSGEARGKRILMVPVSTPGPAASTAPSVQWQRLPPRKVPMSSRTGGRLSPLARSASYSSHLHHARATPSSPRMSGMIKAAPARRNAFAKLVPPWSSSRGRCCLRAHAQNQYTVGFSTEVPTLPVLRKAVCSLIKALKACRDSPHECITYQSGGCSTIDNSSANAQSSSAPTGLAVAGKMTHSLRL
mmetsp:Transcript_67109/g.187774  ORF Transcript_67109/g.187774 Transcript_67109/m.187774 type:complete len:204 (-) Transcript_67109:275-886(-)